MNPLKLSVIVPTYNPSPERLNKTLEGLKGQGLTRSEWELIIIDNKSTNNFQKEIDISWHSASKIVFEPQAGLTYARLRGIDEAAADIVIMVDDDNFLEPNYLLYTLNIFSTKPKLGAIGGKSIPLFEETPDSFVSEFYSLLALRDLGDEPKIESLQGSFPAYAPIGAGMAFRKEAIKTYYHKIRTSNTVISDRKGKSLSSSGDNDMIFEILKNGWEVGYFPQLVLHHIIPKCRTTKQYLANLNFSIQKSWVQFLLSHSISPWRQVDPLTLPLRKLRSWFIHKAWKDDTSYIKWCGVCGRFEGLAK